VKSARDPGVYVVCDLLMWTHVQCTVSWCSAVLHQLRQIRRSVPTDRFRTLVVSLVLTRLDLGQQRPDRSFGVPDPPTPIGAECGCTTDITSADPTTIPHH